MNVALYRLDGGGGHWAMTERGRSALSRGGATLAIGPSDMSWNNDALVINVNEVTAPIPSRIRGVIRLMPAALTQPSYPLEEGQRHHWRPIAPRARVDVSLSSPDSTWSGDAYFDSNTGAEPLEHRFHAWDWARAHRGRDTILFYDAQRRDGSHARLNLRIDRVGEATTIDPVPRLKMPRTAWGIDRSAWSDDAAGATALKTLEDTPFYTRTAFQSPIMGERAAIMHERLSLDRLRSPIVKAMLPFRMPRILW